MAMKRWAITGAAVLLLAGCGSDRSDTSETESGDGASAPVEESDGENGKYNSSYSVDASGDTVVAKIETPEGAARITSGEGGAIDLPLGFTVFPGAEVVTNTVFDRPDSRGALVKMESDASAEEMIAHYRREAEAAGVELELDLTTDTMRMIGGKTPDGSPFSFTATGGGGGATTGQLMVGEELE